MGAIMQILEKTDALCADVDNVENSKCKERSLSKPINEREE